MGDSYIFVEKEGTEYRRKFLMNNDWQVINSSEAKDRPESHSLPGYDTSDWNHCHIPQTPLGLRQSSGKVKDPFLGGNLLKLDGMVYKTRGLFFAMKKCQNRVLIAVPGTLEKNST